MSNRRSLRFPANRSRSTKRKAWLVLLVSSSLVIYPVFLVATLQASLAGLERWLPFSLHSKLSADYSADPRGWSVPPAGMGLIQEAFNDQQRNDPAILITLIALLRTPVGTPQFPLESPSPESTATQRFTAPSLTTTSQPSATPSPIYSASPTSQPSISPTEPSHPPASPTATATTVKPRPTKTQPPTGTPSPDPQPTETQSTPTRTSSPTPKPSPSQTPEPYP